MTIVKRTSNSTLQETLDRWSTELQGILSSVADVTTTSEAQKNQKYNLIEAFCRTFVPPDVTEDDISHFTGNLASDDEYFEAFVRELGQCASGINVERIQGNQKTRAVFTLLPLPGVVDTELDIVRELGFICVGGRWYAEA